MLVRRTNEGPNDGPMEESDEHWRTLELRKRFENRDAESKAQALLDAGRIRERARRKRAARKRRAEAARDAYDGATQLALVEQDHSQAVLLRRSDQTWETNKLLRTMAKTVRDSAEAQRDRAGRLGELKHTLLGLRNIATEEGLARRTTAEDEVDAELSLVEEKRTTVCPRCRRKVLSMYLEQHVLACTGLAGIAAEEREGERALEELVARADADAAEMKRAKSVALAVCPSCGKKMLEGRLPKHRPACERRQARLAERKRAAEAAARASGAARGMDEAERLGHMPPQPPQRVRVVGKTCSTLRLMWEAPVFTGGVPIADYEVTYSLCERRMRGKIVERSVRPPVVHRTSRWCLVNAVHANGCTLRGLRADTEYVNIAVRAVNLIGRSEASNVLASVITGRVEPPSPPLHLALREATASSLTLGWQAPHSDGGSPITHYEVSFMRKPVGDAECGDGGGKQLRHFTVATAARRAGGSGAAAAAAGVGAAEEAPEEAPLTLTIEGLEGNTAVKSIECVAMTEALLCSAPSKRIAIVKTLPPDRRQMLGDEIKRLEGMRAKFVDSTLNQGFSQRFERLPYIGTLRAELDELMREERERRVREEVEARARAEEAEARAALEAAEDAERERRLGRGMIGLSTGPARAPRKARRAADDEAAAAAAAAGGGEGGGDAGALGLSAAEVEMRRKHYSYRIKRLEESLETCVATKELCLVRRSELTRLMEQDERRVRQVHAEGDRAWAFKGKYMDSSVVHGRPQRFLTKSLREALDAEGEATSTQLAARKREVIEVQLTSKRMIELRAQLEAQLNERRAAFSAFEREIARRRKALGSLSKWRAKGLETYFDRWVGGVEERKRQRALVGRVMQRIENREVGAAWRTWVHYLEYLATRDEAEAAISGRGSVLLEKAREARSGVLSEATSALHALNATRHGLREEVGKTKAQKEQRAASAYYDEQREEDADAMRTSEAGASRQMHLNLARGYLGLGREHAALRAFELHASLMQTLEPVGCAEHIAQQGHAYLGIAECYLRMHLHDKAVVHWDRARSLFVEAEEPAGQGDALLGACRTYQLLTLYALAAENGERALALFEDVGDRVKEGAVCRSLADAYRGMHDEEKVAAYAARALDVERDATRVFDETYKRVAEVERLLVSVTAEASTLVPLEVVAAKVPRLRGELALRRAQEREMEEEKAKLAIELAKQRAIFERVEAQLAAVEASHEAEMDSDLVHEGAMQRFRIKELKSSLRKKHGELQEVLGEMEKELRRVKIRISNARDDTEGMQTDLDVELGDLMRHVMSKRVVRCAALNPCNLRGNDVLGTATGGSEQLVCSIKRVGRSSRTSELRESSLW